MKKDGETEKGSGERASSWAGRQMLFNGMSPLNIYVSTGFSMLGCHRNAQENMKHVPRCPDVFLIMRLRRPGQKPLHATGL